MFLRRLRAMLETERTVSRSLGDVRLEVVEKGRRIISFRVQHGSRVPDLLASFSPEVQRQATGWRWSSGRERRMLYEAKKVDPLTYQVVRQVILHDRAAAIEQRMQQREKREGLKQEADREVQPQRTEPDYAAMRAAGMSASEIYALARGVEPVQPVMVATRTRSR